MEGSVYRGRRPDRLERQAGPSLGPQATAGSGLRAGPGHEATERALASVVTAGNRSERFGPLATLLLRSEGVASSFIEGLRSPLADVAAAEVGGTLSDAASYVADNLGAVVGAPALHVAS